MKLVYYFNQIHVSDQKFLFGQILIWLDINWFNFYFRQLFRSAAAEEMEFSVLAFLEIIR